MAKVHRNQVCINRSGQAVTIYRTYQPAPDFVVPKFDGSWDEQKIDWYWKQLRKPNAMGSSDAIGTLQPNDVFAVEDDMEQTGPVSVSANVTFISRGGPLEVKTVDPTTGKKESTATGDVIYLGAQNIRVQRIKRVVGPATLWHEGTPPESADFTHNELDGWVQKVDSIQLYDTFLRSGVGTIPLNSTPAGTPPTQWSYVSFGAEIWRASTTGNAAWVEQQDPGKWAQILYAPFDKTQQGTPYETSPVPIGFSDGVLSATISRMPKERGMFETARAGLVFRAQNSDNLWYFAAHIDWDHTNDRYVIGQRKNGVNTDSLRLPYTIKPEDGDTLVVNFQGNVIIFAAYDSTGTFKGGNYVTNDPDDFGHVRNPGITPTEADPAYAEFLNDETWHGIFTNAVGTTNGLNPEDAIFSLLKFRACPIPYDQPLIVVYDQYTNKPWASAGGSQKVHFNKGGRMQVGYIRSDVDPSVFTPIQTQALHVASAFPGGRTFYTFKLRRAVPMYAPNGKNIIETSPLTLTGEQRKALVGAGTEIGILLNNYQTGDTHPDWLRVDYMKNDNPDSPFFGRWQEVGGYYYSGEIAGRSGPGAAGYEFYLGALIPIGLEHGSLPTQINLILNQDKVFRNYGE